MTDKPLTEKMLEDSFLLRRLVLPDDQEFINAITAAMKDYATWALREQRSLMSQHLNIRNVPTPKL